MNVEKQKPICTALNYGAWGKCDDNQQMRKIFSASPWKCDGGKPAVSKDCKAEKISRCASHIIIPYGALV